MVVFPGKVMEGTRSDRGRIARFRFVTLPEIERTRDHRKALVLGMPVRRNLVPGGNHEAHDERPRLEGIALQDGDLRTLGNRRRRRAPLDVFGIDEVLAFTRYCGACKS